MSRTVLVVTIAGDLHAHSVAIALERKGADVRFWYTSDFPSTAQESLFLGRGETSLRVEGPEVELAGLEVDSVWHRRIGFVPPYDLLHPADHAFAESESRKFREGVLRAAYPRAFWVNPALSVALTENKIHQLALATELGLSVPQSLFSNDPEQIRSFLERQGGLVAYKPLAGNGWSSGERSWACHTVALRQEDLVEDFLLRATPGIYQELVPKAFEIRLTMVGSHAFAAAIYSQETREGTIDWRKAYAEMRMEACTVPEAVLEGCRKLMARLGIVFGCFDLIVTPRNEYVFLEVNQMGQFLFVEQRTGLPILDAFSDLLLAGNPDFPPNPHPRVLFSEIYAEALTRSEQSAVRHVAPRFAHASEPRACQSASECEPVQSA